MNSDKISIIVPIYNASQDLEQCIESIVNQTYKNIEIILVNDGSTDSSPTICESWADKDERIKVINKKNGGLASARNAGLEIATGSYVGFVDSDDYIETNMYENMLNDMIDNKADIVMCSSNGLYENGNIIKSYKKYENFAVHNEELLSRFFKYEKIFCSSVWSKLYKRKIIGDIRFVDDIVEGEDYFFNGRIYPIISCFYYDACAFYNYRIRNGSMSRKGIH